MADPALETFILSEETPFDAPAAARVVERAFGPGRYAKTAERLREGSEPIAGYVLRVAGEVIGSVHLWPIEVGDVRAGFLGPIAVEAPWRGTGAGALLSEAVIARAGGLGLSGVLLVGDRPYFGRFGFEPAPDVRLPGPVDQKRVLWLTIDGSVASGEVRRA